MAKRSRLPKYVTSFRDRHGRERLRFRRKGFATYYFKSEFGTMEWEMELRACKAGETPRTDKTQRILPGSVEALIKLYYQSPKFISLGEETKRTYRGVFRRFAEKHGDKRVAKLERKHIIAILGKMSDRPQAANNLLKRLRVLMVFALDIGWINADPTLRVKGYKTKTEGFKAWTEAEVQQFENFYPIGTRERLAFDLLLYTGQRRGDIVKLGKQHIQGDEIVMRQNKTGTPLRIPIVYPLQLSLDAIKHNHLTFIATEKGTPFSPQSFGEWFRKAVRKAGINDKSSHGLRKVASRRLAEATATQAEIKSVTGHQSDNEVRKYTASADQSKLAKAAMAKLYGNKIDTKNG